MAWKDTRYHASAELKKALFKLGLGSVPENLPNRSRIAKLLGKDVPQAERLRQLRSWLEHGIVLAAAQLGEDYGPLGDLEVERSRIESEARTLVRTINELRRCFPEMDEACSPDGA